MKYYKGLGTSTSDEAKEYFDRFDSHKIDFITKHRRYIKNWIIVW